LEAAVKLGEDRAEPIRVVAPHHSDGQKGVRSVPRSSSTPSKGSGTEVRFSSEREKSSRVSRWRQAFPISAREPRRPAAKSWIGEVGLTLTAVYATGIIARSSPHLAFAAEGPAGSTL
jgi:hypothetical protein